jgi:hypothetical protein
MRLLACLRRVALRLERSSNWCIYSAQSRASAGRRLKYLHSRITAWKSRASSNYAGCPEPPFVSSLCNRSGTPQGPILSHHGGIA